MPYIISWNGVDKTSWTYNQSEKQCTFLAYRIDSLPDFTAPRFAYLCKEDDDRPAEVAKKQLQMIRQLHGLGEYWGISLRLVKREKITIYLVLRCASAQTLSDEMLKSAESNIRNALLQNEYTFQKVETDSFEDFLDIEWAGEVSEIIKSEQEYRGDTYTNGQYQEFYAPFSWIPTDNNMEHLCQALMKHSGPAVAEVTLCPTTYLDEEKKWVGVNVSHLRDCMSGEVIRGQNGRVLWQGRKLPELRTPAENMEKIHKQYDASRVFLYAVRVFSAQDSQSLASAFLVNSVRNDGQILTFRCGDPAFKYLAGCYRSVDISPGVVSSYWVKHRQDAPYRAQRLSRMGSVEEIANFFRLPIPVRPGFPGFNLDTGLDTFSGKKKARSIIKVGGYLDESGSSNLNAQFDSQQFAKHGLIVGVPGSGKTTAMFNILYQLWVQPKDQQIPFIVLEPAKTEYRALKTLPEFKDDLLVFTLGDESVSPFRFNPMEVLPGIKIENHISRLQACFVGAFDLFDPLPIFLEQAIRRTYLEKGWYEDSRGGEEGLETPTLSDLCRNAEYIVSHSGFDIKMKSDFQASLLERLNSLRRGSKGRMLDTKNSIPMEELMERPVVLELDSLNGDEKSLLMMFLLSYVYEYCKVKRKSGSPLKHMLLVEEAHNLISSQGAGSDSRANPKAQTIELFVNMLAEMRALGQGILIADQLPTAIAPQAVKQTNVKILMRVTAKDDREEIGNTMDLNEEQMHQVVNFKTGHAYLYHEGEDRVRMIRMINFKGEHKVEEPPSDEELKVQMSDYEIKHKELYIPYPECEHCCTICNRRVRNQAESFVQQLLLDADADPYQRVFGTKDQKQLQEFKKSIGMCGICLLAAKKEGARILQRYKTLDTHFGQCVYVHILNRAAAAMKECHANQKNCSCTPDKYCAYMEKFKNI